jgi:long-chain acyl-CoA synthetase
VIDGFYGGAETVQVTMEITFEDGRKSSLTSEIAIHGLGAPEPIRKAA